MPAERLLALIENFGTRRVLVVGDIIADEFIYGQIARVSREAPVLILKYDATEMVAGGGANAANNVAALGGRARLAGIVGRDAEGRRLVSSLLRGVERTHIVRARQYRTPVKTRILAGGIHSAKQQVVRIDRDTAWPLSEEVSRVFAAKLVGGRPATAMPSSSPTTVPASSRRRSRNGFARRWPVDRGIVRCRSSSTPATGCSSIGA